MIRKLENAMHHFEQIARAEAQRWKDMYWMGVVQNCDVCSRPMEGERYMVDGPASLQPDAFWGKLCVVCAFKSAPNIGWGKAQLYTRSADGRWKLISGGPPSEG